MDEKLGQTPSQTVGPYFAYGLTPEQYGYPLKSIACGRMAGDDADGERIRIEGRVFDGAGNVVSDAMIEIWQADANGQYGGNAFLGWGRAATDFETTLPFSSV